MQLSQAEENYLKAIFHSCYESITGFTSTNHLAQKLNIKPASVTSMLKKLSLKELILYERYGKVELSSLGQKKAIQIVRKHRLWEVFLVKSLGFSWDEVHEVAEQLEHIQSEKLIDKLDSFLEFPEQDPHGDPIPLSNGKFQHLKKIPLTQAVIHSLLRVESVQDSSSVLLQFLDQKGIGLGTNLKIIAKNEQNIVVQLPNEQQISLKLREAAHILVI